MKRIITLIMVISIALSFNFTAFADEALNGTKQQNQEIKTELAAMKTEFLNNKDDILNLKTKIAASSSEVKAAIASLKENDSQISEEEIENIKQKIEVLKSDKIKLRKNDSSQMNPLIEEFKTAMKSRDFTTAKSCLEKVIDIQESKIQIFSQIESDMNDILEIISDDVQ